MRVFRAAPEGSEHASNMRQKCRLGHGKRPIGLKFGPEAKTLQISRVQRQVQKLAKLPFREIGRWNAAAVVF